MTSYVTSTMFKSYARAKMLPMSIKGVTKEVFDPGPLSAEGRTIRFVISSNAIDRDGDIIKQSGWQLDNYSQNPVVLLNHATNDMPIGKCVNIGVDNGLLRATVEFLPADYPVVGPVAEAVYRMCRDGFLSATSVGFRPIEWDWQDDKSDGILFTRQELLEFSIVTVPSNPQALIEDAPKHQRILNTKHEQNRWRSRLLDLELQH